VDYRRPTTATLEDFDLFLELTSFFTTRGATPTTTAAGARSASTSAATSTTLNKIDVSLDQIARARAGRKGYHSARLTDFEGGGSIIHLGECLAQYTR
jgi:hypothetical protein